MGVEDHCIPVVRGPGLKGGNGIPSRSVFQQLSGGYETGSRVPVAYDPAEARLGDSFHVYPVFGALLVLAGIVVIVTVILIIRG